MNSEKQQKLVEFYHSEDWKSIKKRIEKIVSSLAEVFTNAWNGLKTTDIITFYKLQKQCEWKYIKKGKKYIKVRRHNCEDISKTFSRKIKHYKRKI